MIKKSKVKSQKSKVNTLEIINLHVLVEGKEILKGVDLKICKGEVHAVMGPNGSGKSTLAYALMGHPSYKCQMSTPIKSGSNVKCQMLLNGKNIIVMEPSERARLGLFLAFQNPISVPGVQIINFLRNVYQNVKQKNNPVKITALEFYQLLKNKARILGIEESFLRRSLNDGFSGGEKKKLEMLQLLVLEPDFAIIDEIDTGLDVDSLKLVAKSLDSFGKSTQKPGILIISHYQRIFNYIKPDFVHIIVNGKIVKTGDYSLVEKIEKEGYAKLIS